MNKLILIGNGFDKAHNLPTAYSDFINYFWKNIKNNYREEEYKKFVFIKSDYSDFLESSAISNYSDIVKNLKESVNGNERFYDEKSHECYTNNSKFHPIFKFENNFFKIISISNTIQNWVDIENEYYSELKRIVKLNWPSSVPSKDWILAKRKLVEKLNKEFSDTKNLLETYLINSINKKYNFSTLEDPKQYHSVHEIFKPNLSETYLDNNIDYVKKFLREFSFKEDIDEIKNYVEEVSKGKLNRKNHKSYLLSFNYTFTVKAYASFMRKEEIICSYIHGELASKENKLNFGFGDETDEDYKLIENQNDNEYLNFFKSFQYSQNSNYDDLFSYLDSDKFQVYILGHSCGLSDRVLLNAIFEHNNCRSIKVYYYQKNTDKDNYTDIIQNISRHFKDKKVMRRKIVNKAYCKSLPQNIRFKEN